MLALDDAALARIAIGATRIPPAQRRRWLARVAAKLDPTPPRSAGARRQRRARERERNGRAIFRIECDHDLVVSALIESKSITEVAALDRAAVERELGLFLEAWARRWPRRSAFP
jgi:hypothetical protein